MAGRRGSRTTVLAGWRALWALYLALCIVGISVAEPPQRYAIDLRAQSVADALNGLSEQTGVPVVFPYDLVKDRKANPVVGRYTLLEALTQLLKGTGLSGGISNKGVLTIVPASVKARAGEAAVNENNDERDGAKTFSNGHRWRIATLFAGLAAAFGARAEDAPGPESVNTDIGVEQVTVTAQKRTERLLDVPVPVTVLNTDALADNGQVRLTDYYSQVPGFTVAPTENAVQILTIRGINTGGFTGSNPTVGVLVDGAPYAVASGSALPDIDPGDLARIEVLRGPQGTLYGANSMGGLINYITIDPDTRAFSGRVETNASTVYNGAEPGFGLRASANIPLSDTLAVRLSGYVRQDAGYIDSSQYNLTGINRINSEGARLALLWHPIDSLSIKLTATYQQTKTDGGSEVDPALGTFQTAQLPYNDAYHDKPQIYAARVAYDFGGITLSSNSSYIHNDYYTITDFSNYFSSFATPFFPSPNGTGATFHYTEEGLHRFTEEVHLESSKAERIEWLLGGFYSRLYDPAKWYMNAQDLGTDATLGRIWNYQAPDAFLEYAAFADLTYHFTDAFNFQVGVRETRSETDDYAITQSGPDVTVLKVAPPYTAPISASANKFTYMVSPSYHLSHDVMIYARVATGFRPVTPNPADTIAQGAPKEVLPDTTTNYEVGVKGSFLDSILSVDSSVYYIDWKDIQVQLLTAEGFDYAGNGSGAKSEGVELSAQVRPGRGLTLDGWLSYDEAVLTKPFAFGVAGDRLPFTPRWSGHLSAEDDFALVQDAQGYVSASASYQGQRTGNFPGTLGDPRQEYGSYYKLDARAGVRQGGWTTELYATNLNNSRGELNGGLNYKNPNYFVYIPPRTVGVSISRKF